MNKRSAKKLSNRDEIQVRTEPNKWESGYVIGDPTETKTGVFVTVQAESSGYIEKVRHTDIR